MTDPKKARSLPNTAAYLRLKEQSQSMFDFIVVVSYGIASLKYQIRLLERGIATKLPLPDGFIEGNNPPNQLREYSQKYKQQLAGNAIVSLFAFFEAFVKSAVREMIDYHGRDEEFQRKAEQHGRRFLLEDADTEKLKQKLRGQLKGSHVQRYRKVTRQLLERGYRFPSELFSSYGVRMLVQRLGNLKAADLPDLLRHGLGMDLDNDTVLKFHNIRNIRNRFAHGDPVELSLRDVMHHNKILRELSYEIDRHLNVHFIFPEQFA